MGGCSYWIAQIFNLNKMKKSKFDLPEGIEVKKAIEIDWFKTTKDKNIFLGIHSTKEIYFEDYFSAILCLMTTLVYKGYQKGQTDNQIKKAVIDRVTKDWNEYKMPGNITTKIANDVLKHS
jgi:hypothetical protein